MTSGTIHCDRFIPRPPAEVWRALTEPELLAAWWARGDIAPVVGHRFTMDMGQWGQRPCDVLAVEAQSLLVYSFGGDELDTTITWRLVPEGTGTRLVLEHEGFDLDTPVGRQARRGMLAGWEAVLSRIDGALDTA